MKVALVHDWYNVSAGGEKVMRAILNSFNDKSYTKDSPFTSDWEKIDVEKVSVFSLIDFLNLTDRQYLLNGRYANTSFIEYLPLAKTYYRNYLPFFIKATNSFDLSLFDVIVSSSAAVSKNVKKRPGQIHICYCHTPIRYAWDMEDDYLKHLNPLLRPVKFIIRSVLAKLRKWDIENTPNVDHFLANSHFVAERIKRIYNRDAVVVYPPVDTASFALAGLPRKNFYVTAGRLVSYKNVELIAEAFKNMPDKKLYIIGSGPDKDKIATFASDNIIMLGYQPKDRMVKYIQEAKAFILAAEEDFGITTVEAQSCGTPIIAYKKGGYLETVVDGKTGVFFAEQTHQSIMAAVTFFENNQHQFIPETIRENALRFSEKTFNQKFVAQVKTVLYENKLGQASK
jgi:glycosyltransferase involved in cell wall biosynthesis